MVIGEALGIDPNDFHHAFVKAADLKMLAREGVTFKHDYWRDRHPGVEPLPAGAGWPQDVAEFAFRRKHATLVSLDSLEVCPKKAATP